MAATAFSDEVSSSARVHFALQLVSAALPVGLSAVLCAARPDLLRHGTALPLSLALSSVPVTFGLQALGFTLVRRAQLGGHGEAALTLAVWAVPLLLVTFPALFMLMFLPIAGLVVAGPR